MTELEKQLAEALSELSAQYEREQKQQAERIEALSEQIERLEGQVTVLAEDYRKIAKALRESWRR